MSPLLVTHGIVHAPSVFDLSQPEFSVTQSPLFQEADPRTTPPLSLVGVPGSAAALSKGQKRFNKLVADIQAQRNLLTQWRDFTEVYQRRMAGELVPLQDQLHDQQVAMAKLLDHALDHAALGKTHRTKIKDMLQNLLAEWVTASDGPALVCLHDKHCDMTLAEIEADDMDFTQAVASQWFGVDLDDPEAAQTPEALAQQFAEKIQARVQEEEQAAQERKAQRKKSAKTQAAEAQKAQAAQAATQSLHEVYRKLASVLHPDREPDAAQRDQKTALMRRVNQAYEADDLLALLELQLEIEQIDTQALAGLSEERVTHFNAVLAEQLKQLQAQLLQMTQPFAALLDPWGRRALSPAMVQQALDENVRQLQFVLQQISTDLERFQDIKQLKSHLRHDRIEPQEDDLGMFELVAMHQTRRR